MTNAIKTITISAKCSDLCWMMAKDAEGKQVGQVHDGYVPDFMPNNHYGDYVMLTIDIKTGKILDWKKPTLVQLKNTFNFKG